MSAACRMRIAIAAAALAVAAGCATRTPAPVVDRATSVPAPETATIAVPPPASSAAPATPQPPEKDWRPEFYTVKRGDTLYAIALEHGLDYREFAAMNNIENINVIRIGQVLRLRPPGDQAMSGPGTLPAAPPVSEARPAAPAASQARANTETYKSSPKAVKLPFSEAAFAQLSGSAAKADGGTAAAPSAPPAVIPPLALAAPSTSGTPPAPPPPSAPSAPPAILPPAGESGDDRVDWAWPVRGRILNGYSESASLKGIDIGGSAGVPIVASAPGKVVYAGSGLRGYGKLVIVKHNKTYLSAYAHLDQISVKEGQSVGRGQELGKMGNTDADQVKLHFEIRSLGKPVDPMRYLPRG